MINGSELKESILSKLSGLLKNSLHLAQVYCILLRMDILKNIPVTEIKSKRKKQR